MRMGYAHEACAWGMRTRYAHGVCARAMRMRDAHEACARALRIRDAHNERRMDALGRPIRQARGSRALHQADSLKHARVNITDSSGRAVASLDGGSSLNRLKEGDVP